MRSSHRRSFGSPRRYADQVFRRRGAARPEPASTLDASVGDAGARPAIGSDGGLRESGKGRPTPKRREAERARRQRAVAPTTRRGALRLQRAKARERRLSAREALVRGDERALPRRDQGPVRRLARDAVDSRRSVAEFFLPVAVIVLALSFVRSTAALTITSILWTVVVLLIIVDSVVIVFRLRRLLRARFPNESHRGTVGYALLRSMQLRRLRLPPPRVKPGTKL